MTFTEILLIGIGLSMDAFAVAVSKGLSMQKINYKAGLIIALFFGVFQAGMPLIGYFAAIRFERYIVAADHWVAFGLLLFIGGKAIVEAIKEIRSGEKKEENFKLRYGELVVLAFDQCGCTGSRYLICFFIGSDMEICFNHRCHDIPDFFCRSLYRQPIWSEAESESRNCRRSDPDPDRP